MFRFFLLIFTGISLLPACKSSGVLIIGKLQRITGNNMPSPDLQAEEPPGYAGKVYFFDPVLAGEASLTRDPGLYSLNGKNPRAIATADSSGQFRVRLKPGRYSVLIGQKNLYYSNIIDLDGTINPFVVVRGKNIPLILRADWDALY